jgi:cytochrome c peroxidase
VRAPWNDGLSGLLRTSLVLLAACQGDEWGALHGDTGPDDAPEGFSAADWAIIEGLSPLPERASLDPTNAYGDDPGAAELGQRLFFDESYAGSWSGDPGFLSCAGCHDPERWFQSNGDAVDWRDTPTSVNAAFYKWFLWDGGRDSMWSQSLGPPEEQLGSDRISVVRMLFEKYRPEYEAVFGPLPAELDPAHPDADRIPIWGRPKLPGEPDGEWESMDAADRERVNRAYANFGKALAAYQRRLISTDAPFDRFVAGDEDAISELAKRGLRLFVGRAGCVTCHSGPFFSDNAFHNIGLSPTVGFEGRYDAVEHVLADEFNSSSIYSDDRTTGRLDGIGPFASDLGRFRTKHLRQISETGGYMHAAQIETLRGVIEFYDAGGGGSSVGTLDASIRPLGLDDDDVVALVAFLHTLTGGAIDPALLTDTSRP